MLSYVLVLAFIVLAVLLVWFLVSRDRGPKEPVMALWAAVGWGAAGAVAAGFIENNWIRGEALQTGQANLTLLMASLSVGLIEEICKFGPLALWIYKKRYFNEHTDGVIYFALAGLGFGLPENILYTVQYGEQTGLVRLLLTPLFHAATTGVIGYFLIRRKLQRRPVWGVGLPLLLVAMLHAVYDFGLLADSAAYEAIALLATLGVSGGLFVLLLRARELDQNRGLSAVGHNSFCRACGWANPEHDLYCTHCGKIA